ncbi:MAG: hypothetical protein WBQ52_16955, partial [Terracidiphilus sp.]
MKRLVEEEPAGAKAHDFSGAESAGLKSRPDATYPYATGSDATGMKRLVEEEPAGAKAHDFSGAES